MQLTIKPLPSELQKIAENELGEVPERIPNDIQALRTWIAQQPHLNARVDEQFLIQFLRGCKYSLEKAKSKIDLFFTLKTKFPILFNNSNINDKQFRTLYNYGYGLPLPLPLNDHGVRIFYLKFEGDFAKGLLDMDQLFGVISVIHEIMLLDDPYVCVNGIIYIVDLKDITLNMVAKFTPGFLKKLVQFFEKSIPLRIKAAYYVNTPAIFQSVLNILLPMFSEKLKKRIQVYGQNYQELLTNISYKYLPKDLGGENGSTNQLLKDFEVKLLQYENYFKENIHYGTNEMLRPGKPIDFDSLYGLGGSFRKLDVD